MSTWRTMHKRAKRPERHFCEEKLERGRRCPNPGFPCWYPGSYDAPDLYLCSKHQAGSFCYGCGQFRGGVESFDFGRFAGWCENCQAELEGDLHDYYEAEYDDFDYEEIC